MTDLNRLQGAPGRGVGLVQQKLSAVPRFHEKCEAGTASEEDQDDHLRDSDALSSLLELDHRADSGVSFLLPGRH
ncbi:MULTISPECIES: hypothetical protein [unclassified Pseudomonas]|uniref:hypothetical protein n=1 Tax=unclassified Pseudomonas TaxID=196821 RepID=UPI0025E01C58|nr:MULTISPECIES: hypothetical protein [unclassified Pseudomonas]